MACSPDLSESAPGRCSAGSKSTGREARFVPIRSRVERPAFTTAGTARTMPVRRHLLPASSCSASHSTALVPSARNASSSSGEKSCIRIRRPECFNAARKSVPQFRLYLRAGGLGRLPGAGCQEGKQQDGDNGTPTHIHITIFFGGQACLQYNELPEQMRRTVEAWFRRELFCLTHQRGWNQPGSTAPRSNSPTGGGPA